MYRSVARNSAEGSYEGYAKLLYCRYSVNYLPLAVKELICLVCIHYDINLNKCIVLTCANETCSYYIEDYSVFHELWLHHYNQHEYTSNILELHRTHWGYPYESCRENPKHCLEDHVCTLYSCSNLSKPFIKLAIPSQHW